MALSNSIGLKYVSEIGIKLHTAEIYPPPPHSLLLTELGTKLLSVQITHLLMQAVTVTSISVSSGLCVYPR